MMRQSFIMTCSNLKEENESVFSARVHKFPSAEVKSRRNNIPQVRIKKISVVDHRFRKRNRVVIYKKNIDSRVPKNGIRRTQWLKAIGLDPSLGVSKYAIVCSEHFSEDSFDKTSACGLIRLRDNAVPVVENIVIVVDDDKIVEDIEDQLSIHNVPPFCSVASPIETEKLNKYTQISETICLGLASLQQLTEEVKRLKTLHKYTKLQLRNIQKRQIRKERKIASLRNIIVNLRKTKLLNKDNLNIFSNLTVTAKELCLRQLKRTKEYTPDLRKFAMTLHCHSPEAYEYVRSEFSSCLPHPRVLAKWYSDVKSQPGFTKEQFKAKVELR